MTQVRLSDYVARRLQEHGVRHVFMLTGGGAMHLNDAMGRVDGLKYVCCHHSDIRDAVRRTLEADGPAICEIMTDKAQQFAPKLSSRKLEDGTMVTAPLEDLAPFLPREELEANMMMS